MTASRLERDIAAQADSLASVLQHQFGEGKARMLEAASLIRSSPQVLITGMGASLYAAMPLQYSLCSRGIDAVLVEAGELLHYMHPAYRSALAIVISRSGESIEIARLLSILTPRQTVVGVTNEPNSLLAREAHHTLTMGSHPDEYVAVQTYTGTVAALYLLAAALDDAAEQKKEELERLLPAMSRLIAQSLEDLKAWDSFLQDQSTVHLLARGPSTGSALEGALLFNEIAKYAAVAMPIASFRHGPVELVEGSFRGIIFVPAGKTRELTLSLARDVKGFGGQIRLIGPLPEGDAGETWCEVPSCPEALAPLLEVIPVQAAALRFAQIRGIAPGSFRYAPQVARDEASFPQRAVSTQSKEDSENTTYGKLA